MAKKSSIDYRVKFKAIKNYTQLGINSNKKNYTPQEKRQITRYYNLLKGAGFFDIQKSGEFIEKVKFVKGNKKTKISGAPRLKGTFIWGAAPTAKVKGNKIIGEFYDKTFLPLDTRVFDDPDLDLDLELSEYDEIALEVINEAVAPIYEDIKTADYFSFVLQNGSEIGQKKSSRVKKISRRDGQKYAANVGPDLKLSILADSLAEFMRGVGSKYKNTDIIKGLYWYEMKNQRTPNKREKKIAKTRKRK